MQSLLSSLFWRWRRWGWEGLIDLLRSHSQEVGSLVSNRTPWIPGFWRSPTFIPGECKYMTSMWFFQGQTQIAVFGECIIMLANIHSFEHSFNNHVWTPPLCQAQTGKWGLTVIMLPAFKQPRLLHGSSDDASCTGFTVRNVTMQILRLYFRSLNQTLWGQSPGISLLQAPHVTYRHWSIETHGWRVRRPRQTNKRLLHREKFCTDYGGCQGSLLGRGDL